MTAREMETRRRRRLRREALAAAEREWVLGGPPLVGWDTYQEAIRYMDRIVVEALEVGRWFASRCWVRRAVERRMVRDLEALLYPTDLWAAVSRRNTATLVTD